MADGTERPCEGCPDAQWRTVTEKGVTKRTRNCSVVWNLLSIDRDSGQPFIIRFKRTSLPVIKSHLQKYHLKRRPVRGGGLSNYPLYCFSVKLSCKMAAPTATYSVPIIEKTGILPGDEIVAYARALTSLRPQTQAVIERAESHEQNEAADDTSFEYGAAASDKYAADVGQDFTPMPGDKAGAK
jgi:hypothetical protein